VHRTGRIDLRSLPSAHPRNPPDAERVFDSGPAAIDPNGRTPRRVDGGGSTAADRRRRLLEWLLVRYELACNALSDSGV
jgi:hypothetical protein